MRNPLRRPTVYERLSDDIDRMIQEARRRPMAERLPITKLPPRLPWWRRWFGRTT